MKKLLKAMMLMLAFGASFQQVRAEDVGMSFDFTPAVAACIKDGMRCLDAIPVISLLFDQSHPGPKITDSMKCDSYLAGWCMDWNHQTSFSGFTSCREAKMGMYEEKARKAGVWPFANWEGRKGTFWLNRAYMENDVEERLTKKGQAPFFNCNVKQQIMFIKSACGDRISKQWPHGQTLPSPYIQDNLCGSKIK